MDEGWRRVGARVDAERARRGYPLVGFARACGVGKTTIDKLVHSRRSSYDPATIAAVETALGWQHGSIERVRRGLEPRDHIDPDLTAVIEAWPRLSADARRMLRRLATDSDNDG